MTRLEQLKHDIRHLPYDDFVQLKNWFNDVSWHDWDVQIEADSAAGKLDFLLAIAAKAEKEQNFTEL